MNLRRAELVVCAIVLAACVAGLGLRSASGQQDADRVAGGPVNAQQDPDALAQQVYALFQENCLECHGGMAEIASELDLRTDEGLQRGGVKGAAVVAHDPEASPLYTQLIRASRPFMPFGRPQLADDEIDLVRRWIVAGASLAAVPEAAPGEGPTAEDLARMEHRPITDEERAYWAFVQPARHAVPEVSDTAWSDNPIDAFLLAAMQAGGASPASEADKITLVRRAYLDVHGLPPTPEQIDAFVNDDSPDAWENLIDELLGSPHYGERWARHWMDLVRYADSGGFEFDVDRPYMYRYRDYLVDSFNDDKPYDMFVRQQLAGDEYAPDSDEAMIATGMLRVGPEAGAGELNRLDELDDLITTTSLAFMGMTVGCARCHNHKFDPIAQADYYRMQAVFWPTRRAQHALAPADEVATNREERRRLDELIKPLQDEKKDIEAPYLQIIVDREVAKLPEYLQVAYHTPPEERTEGQRLNVVQIEDTISLSSLRGLITEEHIVELMPAEAIEEHSRVKAEIQVLEDQKPERLPTVRVIGERGREPEPSYFLHRGSPDGKGSVMAPGVLTVASEGEWDFPEPPLDVESSWRRRGFAEWLVDENNPLTARVMVNRLWQHHFGEGIVRTSSNFGMMGQQPSHPQLLDWLAVEFVDRGWSMKHMHRLMLTSHAYRMAATNVDASYAVDPENRLVWRMPRLRLEAEIVRDAIMQVAGTLDLSLGGPAIFPYIDPDLFEESSKRDWAGLPDSDPSTWRRSLYVFSKRSIRYPMFETFDQPNLVNSIDRRNRTTIAPQALILMNNPMVLFQAEKFAERVRAEVGDDVATQIDRAMLLALGRHPVPAELSNAIEFISESPDGLVEFCHLLFNLNEFLHRP